MFFISLPHTIKIGDTVDCRINRKPAKVTWAYRRRRSRP
jgi:hypothetical protein